MVEVETRGRKNYVVSCLYPVAKDLVVRTRSERVDKIRDVILAERRRNLLPGAMPGSR